MASHVQVMDSYCIRGRRLAGHNGLLGTGVRRAPAPPPHAQRGGAAVAGVPAERGALLSSPSACPSGGPYSIALHIQPPCGSHRAGEAQGVAMPLKNLECQVSTTANSDARPRATPRGRWTWTWRGWTVRSSSGGARSANNRAPRTALAIPSRFYTGLYIVASSQQTHGQCPAPPQVGPPSSKPASLRAGAPSPSPECDIPCPSAHCSLTTNPQLIR